MLPDPAPLAPGYTSKTRIGYAKNGTKGGTPAEIFICKVADHMRACGEDGGQGISRTAGVPAVVAAIPVANGSRDVTRLADVEELDPRAFIAHLNRVGLPKGVRDAAGDRMVGLVRPQGALAPPVRQSLHRSVHCGRSEGQVMLQPRDSQLSVG